MTLSASQTPPDASGPLRGAAGRRLRAADLLLADRGQLLRALFLSAPIATAAVGVDGRMLVVNPAFCTLTGRRSDDLIGRHLDLLSHPDDVPVEDLAVEHTPGRPLIDPQLEVVGERRLQRADGETVWVSQSREVVHRTTGEPQFVLLTLVDVTDARRAEDDLVRRAYIDPLTGLPNRRALTERLQHALAVSRRRGTTVGVLHLDLDRFTAVNDSLGVEGGDQLLCQVADRLRWSTRVEDMAVRFGADEFLVLAEEVDDVDALRTLADRLLGVLDEPFQVHDREITLSASVGVTLGADMAPEALLRQAHSALARAKASGGRGRIEVHDGALSDGDVDQLQLETDLRRALEADELRLFYQPIVALSDERLLGYEALIRWQHPTRGLLPPGAFLSAAEDNRLTSRLGEWVLYRACLDAATWDGDLRVHVNISARHLAEPGFSDLVSDALTESGLAPGRLELEITESTALFAAEATLRSVSEVTERGVTLALDDFGTGYSAISALHRLPIHTLKIDRSFVADVVDEPATAALVQGLLQLGAGMGLQVIAEGIEDGEQARWLREHGCAMAQGYAFGRPAPLPPRPRPEPGPEPRPEPRPAPGPAPAEDAVPVRPPSGASGPELSHAEPFGPPADGIDHSRPEPAGGRAGTGASDYGRSDDGPSDDGPSDDGPPNSGLSGTGSGPRSGDPSTGRPWGAAARAAGWRPGTFPGQAFRPEPDERPGTDAPD